MKSRFFNCVLLSCSMLLISERVSADELRIAATADATEPLKIGDQLPDVKIQSANGEERSLKSFQKDGPLVIVFFRGSWCPFCTRHFNELIKVHPEVTKLGATMVAISPDNPDNTQANFEKVNAPFPLASDSKLAAASAFGLAFQVDDATLTRYQGFGIDLEQASGEDHHALPVPAVYIVDSTGKITFAHSDVNYRQRLNANRIVEELMQLK